MTLTSTTSIAAERAAARNCATNLSALEGTQPSLRAWVTDQRLDVEWVLARDGSLTALDGAGQWWAGSSLPLRAARAMLAKLELRGAIACFLAPSHAGQLRAALDRLRPEQAVVAILPEMRDLTFILHCDDFASDIRAHRLWFAAGPAWDVGLRQIFDDEPGLATPAQFIRMQDAEAAVVDEMIATAQKVFGEVGTSRASALQALRQRAGSVKPASSKPKICVVAPSRFRLWNDLGGAMLSIFENRTDIELSHFDCDDPAFSSPLALLRAADNCDAIFTANTGRSDLPGVVSDSTPWITWVNVPRVPSNALAGVDDHLIVSSNTTRTLAIQSGWPDSRVHLGAWPQTKPLGAGTASNTKKIAVFADTYSLETPKDLTDYSSHGLLWEAIRNELARNPFVLEDVNRFLNDRMRQLGVSDDATFPRARFVERLILPAYQQGFARALLQRGVSLKLHGTGWRDLPFFEKYACGPITTREQFQQVISECDALAHVWPGWSGHPIEALGVPLVRDVKTAASPQRTAPKPRMTQSISFDLIQRILVSVGH